jgi:hypothetical protein
MNSLDQPASDLFADDESDLALDRARLDRLLWSELLRERGHERTEDED